MSSIPGQSTRRVAVITGASSGIGAATAHALAASGLRVVLLARRAERIDAIARELGASATAIQADVTDRAALAAAAERVETELGGADVLVNNAGIMLLAPFTPDRHDDHRRMVETNLLGALTATEVFVDQIRDRQGDLSAALSCEERFHCGPDDLFAPAVSSDFDNCEHVPGAQRPHFGEVEDQAEEHGGVEAVGDLTFRLGRGDRIDVTLEGSDCSAAGRVVTSFEPLPGDEADDAGVPGVGVDEVSSEAG